MSASGRVGGCVLTGAAERREREAQEKADKAQKAKEENERLVAEKKKKGENREEGRPARSVAFGRRRRRCWVRRRCPARRRWRAQATAGAPGVATWTATWARTWTGQRVSILLLWQ